ncbi:DNA-binding MarR family transcriptional regulator [Parvibaculum indicum]|uniref:MarR family winged helix-turn-helix transcriptional regulator n=1 Tax=Parvibaculum indicum TaxID=562969 RepID=UPI00141E3E80|nr:helix-turn-helix domain-containing protein [Parvibaculum indicum]NIJ43319.1 DNA-binding MarR family transcriptional regulator [Parvibaculum indicum]
MGKKRQYSEREQPESAEGASPKGSEDAPTGAVPGSLTLIPGQQGKKLQTLLELIDTVNRLHFELGAMAARIHGEADASAPHRALLRNLIEMGPRTVPQLASLRSVSRQFIQKLVNRLLKEGMVEYIDNPAHKRSRLVRIAPRGYAAYRAMRDRETPAGKWLAGGLSKSDLRTALDVLSAIEAKATGYTVAGRGEPAGEAGEEADATSAGRERTASS